MKRNTSLAVALALAVTAAARIPASHTAATVSQVQAAKSAVSRPRRAAGHVAAGYTGGCTAYDVDGEGLPPDENRGSAKKVLDKFFHGDPLRETADSLSSEPGVRYAIALAPDPRHTNLSLIFDREMAVIQQAAQDESYTYDSSWLPWSVDQSSYQLLADQEAADDMAGRREACPGLLLFRRSVSEAAPAPGASQSQPYLAALVVLVVGEQPTGGLNEDQWNNAVLWLARNAADKEGPAPAQGIDKAARPAAANPHSTGPRVNPASDTPGAARILRILGPSFSGSLVSLGRDLARLYPVPAASQARPTAFAAKFTEARVLSGGVSDCASVRSFQQLQWPQSATAIRPAVVFGTFAENDDRQIYNFLSYLKAQGTEANDAAILSEDETAYSGRGEPDAEPSADQHTGRCAFDYASQHHPVRLFFPRDISALRNAYQKESIFASSVSGSGEHSGHTILQEGGEQSDEGGNVSDTIEAYSRHLTPFAQEAQLYGIVSYLRSHHTRYLLLRCTNQLDFLFLTRFFHRAYPEGRIVTVGSDLLFRREIDTTEFRGVFALTNYPLVPRNQHWSMLTEQPGPLHGHAHRAFENSTIEGTYIAARYLFSSGSELAQPGVHASSISLPLMESLPEYADPFWMHHPGDRIGESRAPTWLAVVGREGYWPIAVLNDRSTPRVDLEKNSGQDPDPEKDKPPSTMVRLTSTSAHYDLDPNSHRRYFNKSLRSSLPLAWTLSAGMSLLLLIYQVGGILVGDTNASSGLFSAFRKVEAPSQDILLGFNSAFATMLLVALVSIGMTIPWSDMFASADAELVSFVVLGALSTLAIAAILLWKRGRLAVICYLSLLSVLGGIFLGMLLAMLVRGEGALTANGVPLFYRMGHITSGVAPLLPVLFVLSGFYLWSWHAMAGNVLLCNGRPKLPMQADVPAKTGFKRWYWHLIGNPVDKTGGGDNRLKASEMRMSQEMGKGIIAMASPLGFPFVIVFLPLCLLVGSWICFHNDLPLLTMEGRAFALWLNYGLLFAFLVIAAEASRLFWTWIELRRLLTKLGRLRLRRTFARLRAIEASSLWGMSGSVQRVQYRFFSQQLEAARRLSMLPSSIPLPYLCDAVSCGEEFETPSAAARYQGSRWTIPIVCPISGAVVTIRDAFSDAVAEVINLVLLRCWKAEGTSLNLVMDGPHAGASGEEENGAALDLPLSENLTIRMAEEFVCFHYIAFVQNILARMRTMALSMVLLFVAISLAISFYPFVPRTQVTMWMMVNLVLIGGAVIYVYAGMDRDEILSYISNSRPGRLSAEFWLKTAAFLAGPVIGIVATQFPAVADSVLGWVQPGLDAIK